MRSAEFPPDSSSVIYKFYFLENRTGVRGKSSFRERILGRSLRRILAMARERWAREGLARERRLGDARVSLSALSHVAPSRGFLRVDDRAALHRVPLCMGLGCSSSACGPTWRSSLVRASRECDSSEEDSGRGVGMSCERLRCHMDHGAACEAAWWRGEDLISCGPTGVKLSWKANRAGSRREGLLGRR